MAGRVGLLEHGKIKVQKINLGYHIMFSRITYSENDSSIGIYVASTKKEKEKYISRIKHSLGNLSLEEIFKNHSRD